MPLLGGLVHYWLASMGGATGSIKEERKGRRVIGQLLLQSIKGIKKHY